MPELNPGGIPTLVQLHVTLQAVQATSWPHYAGSSLRGAFGRALRRAACVTGQSTCQACPLRTRCAYGVVFDPAAPAQPLHPSFTDGQPLYIVQPPALGACRLSAGQTQTYSLVLLPGSQSHHRLIEHVLKAATEQEVHTPGSYRLHSITSQATPVTALPTAVLTQPNKPAHTTLRWQTPLRIQQQGKPIFNPQQLDAGLLVRAMLRRRAQWHQITGQAAPDNNPALQAASACQLDTRKLEWHDMQRYSSTQNQHLPLSGFVGSASLTGPAQALHTLQPLLKLAEQLHVGKETVMGLGRYQLGELQTG